MTKVIKGDRGLSYLEIVLALAVLAYIVLAFAQLFMSSAISVKETEFQTLANTYASDYMEDIKHMEYSTISTGTWTAQSQALGQDGKVFTRQTTVSELSSGLKQVRVQVNWTDVTGSRNIEITSLIADY